jgi:hypothetical protein
MLFQFKFECPIQDALFFESKLLVQLENGTLASLEINYSTITYLASIPVTVNITQANSHLNHAPRLHVPMSTDSHQLLVVSAERKINMYDRNLQLQQQIDSPGILLQC